MVVRALRASRINLISLVIRNRALRYASAAAVAGIAKAGETDEGIHRSVSMSHPIDSVIDTWHISLICQSPETGSIDDQIRSN